MAQQVYSKALTTNGSGAASGTVAMDGALGAGLLHAVYVDIGTWTAGAVDITITDTQTGIAILTLSNLAASGRYMPRAALHDTAGSAIASAYGAAPVGGSVTVVIAGGGATLTGTVYLYVER
jgi:hypothetical protein